jgi:hypothetical protein
MSNRASALVALTLAVAVAAGLSIRAQRFGGRGRGRNRIPETSRTLASLRQLKCTFPEKQGDPIVSIDKIDADEGTAEVVGFFRRPVGVNVKLVGSNLHFLDVALDGGLTVITVFPTETHDGRLQAVYSHAAYPDAAQYQGDCDPGR